VFVSKLNSSGSALVYSTYLGGSKEDGGEGIALDSSGDAYVTGTTDSGNFPTTAGAFQSTFGGSYDAFVSKLDSSGSALVYSTYLGGSNRDAGAGIALDSQRNACVTGYTDSSNFPTTAGALQTTYGGFEDAFVSKLALTTCTVTYKGTFNGNLTISSGLTCIIKGTVTGNVLQSNGSVLTSNSTIGGNLRIVVGSFSIDAGTTIDGNLQIQNIPAGSAQNQICGTRVRGNLQFDNNGTAVAIGTTSASCPGNTIGGNLQVNNNTAAVQVFDDTVGGNLQCRSNSSITGGGDMTKGSLQGQCAAF
jgi:Beta-propeller repeat